MQPPTEFVACRAVSALESCHASGSVARLSFLRLLLILATSAGLTLGFVGGAGARAGHYGGVLVVGLANGEPDSLDPTVSQSGQSLYVYQLMCLKLYQTVANHGTLTLEPLLAATPPVVSKDKLTVTVQLRQGIVFNDGTPFNAEAVVATDQRFMSYPGSSRLNGFIDVGSVTTSGPYTVVFHLTAPDSTFTGNTYVLSPSAVAAEGANFGANPVCAGPFMFDHRVVGDNVTIVKSPYWYKRAAVHLDKVVFKPMPQGAPAAEALEAGDIQVLNQVQPSDLPGVSADKNLKVLSSPELGFRGILINLGNRVGLGKLPYAKVNTPLAQSPPLRQAFEEAIDRQALNKVVFQGLYEPTCTMVSPQSSWFDAVKVACTPYNPADAKKLVAKSGIPNPTVHVLAPQGSALAQFIQAEEETVGINVVIDSADNVTSIALRNAGNFDAVIPVGLEPGGDDPDDVISQFVATSGTRNWSGYSNPRMDLILSNALKATSRTARATLYRTAQQLIEMDRPIIPLYNDVTLAAYSTSLTGITLNADGSLSLVNAQYK